MNKEQETKEVYTLLEEKVNEVFRARQEVHGIISGDISPPDAVKLDALTELLAGHIAHCIMWEVPNEG